jgi:uncharacterized OB-fold protein
VPKIIPPVVGHDDEYFWDGVARGELRLQRCDECGTLRHPPIPMCGTCGSLRWHAEAASGRGTVFSWIQSRHPTEPDAAPRLVAVVELTEGLRFVTNLVDVAIADVGNDMAVEVTFRDFDGVVLPVFRPAAESGPGGAG